jgi:hypothetical protein
MTNVILPSPPPTPADEQHPMFPQVLAVITPPMQFADGDSTWFMWPPDDSAAMRATAYSADIDAGK